MGYEFVIGEADNDEYDGQQSEAHQLDGLPAYDIDESDCNPVAGDRTGADNDQVADSGVVEDLVHAVALRVADGAEDDGIIEAKPVEGNLIQVSQVVVYTTIVRSVQSQEARKGTSSDNYPLRVEYVHRGKTKSPQCQ